MSGSGAGHLQYVTILVLIGGIQDIEVEQKKAEPIMTLPFNG